MKIAQSDEVLPILEPFNEKLRASAEHLGADVLAFCDRPWMGENLRLPKSDKVQVSLLSFEHYDRWFSKIKSETRNAIRKSAKMGIEIRDLTEPSTSQAQEILGILKETAFRGGVYFAGYDFWNLNEVMKRFRSNEELIPSVALYQGKIIGCARVRFKGEVAVINSLYSSITLNKTLRGVTNALLAAQVRLLSDRGVKYLAYGLRETLPGVESFQKNNGFEFIPVNYNYLLLSHKASLASIFGHYRPRYMVAYKLKPITPLLYRIQRRLPVYVVQKLHLYG